MKKSTSVSVPLAALAQQVSGASADVLLSFDRAQAWYVKEHPVIVSGGMALRRNTVTGLVGANGAGKTTLVRALCNIHHAASFDQLRFEGAVVAPGDPLFKRNRYACFAKDESFRFWDFKRLIVLIEQAFSLERDQAYLDSLINGFALEGIGGAALSHLSDGQRKKAALVTSLYARRKLLLLDEPVDFLDFSSTEFLYKAIGDYSCSYGSILLSSHVAEAFTRCCSCLYAMSDARITGPYEVPERAEDVAGLFKR